MRFSPLSSLTLKNMPDDLLESLRQRAREQRRSLNSEAIILLEKALAADALAPPASVVETERNAQLAAWEQLGGRWPDGDAALDSLILDIVEARTEGREVDL